MSVTAKRPLNFAGLAVAMTIGALGIVGINLYSDRSFVAESLLERARAHAQDIVIMRRWIADYGGVYVEKRPGIESSPYFPDPDLRTADGRVLTLRTPAMMVRELSAYTPSVGGSYRSRVSSLRPLNPANAPDRWEVDALRRFERGEKEIYERVAENGRTIFRYMVPLVVEPSCLGCHVERGYKVGDVRGGLSVAFDVSDAEGVFRDNAIATGVAVVLILFGVGQLILLSLRSIRQAGREADRERRRFESLVQTTDGIVWEADPQTLEYSFVSNQAEALLGYPVADWTRPGFWTAHVHPDDREWATEYRRGSDRRDEEHDVEYRFLAHDGRVVWLHELASTVVEEGRPRVLRGLTIDVTHRKEAELQARKAQAEQAAILNNALVGIVYLRQRTIVHCNPRFEEIFGYGPGELVGCSTRLLYSSDTEYQLVGREAYPAIGREEAYSREVLLRRRDGRVFWGVLTGRAIDPAHPLEGSIWIYADISERKQAAEQASKLLRAVEQSPVSILITDREGTIEYVNPRFCQVSGYSRDEALGRNPRLLQSGETPSEVYRALWTAILAGHEWRGVLGNRRKNGELFWEDASIAPILNERGEITHFLAVKEDITERRRVEQELQRHRDHLEDEVRARTCDLVVAMQRAKAADRAKSAFLTHMSHEMRTPLNAIIGFCRLAQRTDLSAQQRDYVEKIDAAGEHLLDLINNLLDLSKIAAGRVELLETEFDPQNLVARVASTFGLKAEEKGLAFTLRVAPEVPHRLVGDGLRLNQVLLNLVANAVKFTERGSVAVAVECTPLPPDRVGLRFEVEDTGIGMDEAEIQRAFEPFAQGDASITRRYGGTGLGLAISRELVSLLGGSLEVDSEKGRGSRFGFALEFALPRPARPAGESGSGGAAVDYRFDGVRVLVVEDQAMNRQVAEELLQAVGAAVETAANGRLAVDRLFEAGPGVFDLVLMDLQMPEFDGLSATRAIRADPRFDALPIVALTAHVLEEERRRSAEAGADDHLGKPFQPEQLYATIARWVDPSKVSTTPRAPVRRTPASAAFGAASAAFAWPEGLDRFDGRGDRYLAWLERFCSERAAAADEIGALLVQGARDEALRRAHALKGLAGTLGLGDVQAAAEALERWLEAGGDADTAPLRAAIAAATRRVADASDAWRRQHPGGDEPAGASLGEQVA